MSLREQLLASTNLRTEPVTFLGHECIVRAWTARERDAWDANQRELDAHGKALDNFRARTVVASLRDANGDLVFQPDDAEAVGMMDAAEVSRVYDVCARVHGFVDDPDSKKNT